MSKELRFKKPKKKTVMPTKGFGGYNLRFISSPRVYDGPKNPHYFLMDEVGQMDFRQRPLTRWQRLKLWWKGLSDLP